MNTPTKPKRLFMTMRLDGDLRDRIAKMAATDGRTICSMIRMILQDAATLTADVRYGYTETSLHKLAKEVREKKEATK